jgi:hypothetical protein
MNQKDLQQFIKSNHIWSCCFTASGDPILNGWNVPHHDHRHHLHARELLAQANMLVQDLVPALDGFYMHCEERVRIFADAVGEPMSDVNKRVKSVECSCKTISILESV